MRKITRYTIASFALRPVRASVKHRNGEVEMHVLAVQNWFIYLKQFADCTKINIRWKVVPLGWLAGASMRAAHVKFVSINMAPSSTATISHSGNYSMVENVETTRIFEYERFKIIVPIITTSEFQFP